MVAYLLCELDLLLEIGDRSERLIGTGMILYGMNTCAALLLVNLGCGGSAVFSLGGGGDRGGGGGVCHL